MVYKPFRYNDAIVIIKPITIQIKKNKIKEIHTTFHIEHIENSIESITHNCLMDVFELYTALLQKATFELDDVPNLIRIISLYRSLPIFYNNTFEKTDRKFIRLVINVGIARHIDIFRNVIKVSLGMDSKSKLLEWAMSYIVSLDEILVLKNIEKDHVLQTKSWYDDQKLFSSQISTNRSHLSQAQGDTIDDHLVPRVITKPDECG